MALLTAPTHRPRRVAAGPGRRARLAARLGSTPGRLTLYMAAMVVLGLAAGTAAVVGTEQRGSLISGVRTSSGPLTVQAQLLYRSLSDADATAASAFLYNGVEPQALRDRYLSDIAAAGQSLATATAASDVDHGAADLLARQLPVYTGLVEMARAYNRLNLPLGAAYLREASTVMRKQLLPAAQQLYHAEYQRLAQDRSGATEFPWLSIPLLMLTLAGLVASQRFLTRRTNRVLSLGLAGAGAAGLAALLWLAIASYGVASHMSRGDSTGSAEVDLLARARVAALTAHADEALTLIARGNGGDFETDFGQQLDALAGPSGLLAQAERRATDPGVRAEIGTATRNVADWRAVHTKVTDANTNGRYNDAVKLTVGTDPSSAGSRFTAIDTALGGGIATASAAFDTQARAADGDLAGAAAGLGVLGVLLLAGVAVGFQQRIAEYR